MSSHEFQSVPVSFRFRAWTGDFFEVDGMMCVESDAIGPLRLSLSEATIDGRPTTPFELKNFEATYGADYEGELWFLVEQISNG